MKNVGIGCAVLLFIVVALGACVAVVFDDEDTPKADNPIKNPKTTEGKVKYAAYETLGTKTSEDKKRIKELQVTDHAEGGKMIFIKLNGDLPLSNGTAKRELLQKSAGFFDEVFKVKEVSEVRLRWFLPGEDKYGNATDLDALHITITRETAEKANWGKDGIEDKIPGFADEYRIHQSIDK